MLKINSYSLLFFSALFCINSANVLCLSPRDLKYIRKANQFMYEMTGVVSSINGNATSMFLIPSGLNLENLENTNTSANHNKTISAVGFQMQKETNQADTFIDTVSTQPYNSYSNNSTYPIPIDTINTSVKKKKGSSYSSRVQRGKSNKEKLYKCGTCNKGFAKKVNLKAHQLTHTGAKPFKCDFCKKRFPSKALHQGHLKKHKHYECGICGMPYATKDRLKSHIDTHSGLNPFICPYCSVAFTHKTEYKHHILYEEGENEDRKCHKCKKGYSSKYTLKQHNKRAHPET